MFKSITIKSQKDTPIQSKRKIFLKNILRSHYYAFQSHKYGIEEINEMRIIYLLVMKESTCGMKNFFDFFT